MALRPAFLSCPFKLRKTDTILLLIDLEIFTLRDIPRENAELTCDIPERADDTILLKPDLVTLRIMSTRSEEHTSELQSRGHLVCRLRLEKKKQKKKLDILENKVQRECSLISQM